MKKIQDMDITNKRVVVRCDFNVPIKDGKILDNYKIVSSLQTINYLIDNDNKVIILSHLGKVKSEEDKKNNSLEIVAQELDKLIDSKVLFSKSYIDVEEKIEQMNFGDVLVLENTRVFDFPNKLESNNDISLAEVFASFGDVFVMDAFGSSHRRHASTYGISKFLPSCLGFLVQKEMEMLDNYVLDSEKPFVIIMGGAKVEDKLVLMEKLLGKCDKMIVAGGLANTFLSVLDFNVGNSLVSDDEESLVKVKWMLSNYKDKIVLPYDVIVGNNFDNNYVENKDVNNIDNNDIIKDIGIKTINNYKEVINGAKTVFVNGTVGVYEDIRFVNGTRELLSTLASCGAKVVVGGGDASSAVHNLGFDNKFLYVSTGGGATLDYIINEKMAVDDEEEEIETL